MPTNLYSDAHLGWFDKNGLKRPEYMPHGSEDEIERNMRKLLPNSWRLEGNKLIGKTDMGELVQFIDPAYILTGSDDQGLPVFRKVVL